MVILWDTFNQYPETFFNIYNIFNKALKVVYILGFL